MSAESKHPDFIPYRDQYSFASAQAIWMAAKEMRLKVNFLGEEGYQYTIKCGATITTRRGNICLEIEADEKDLHKFWCRVDKIMEKSRANNHKPNKYNTLNSLLLH